ncbi:DDE-type integrase/transposase/recombinase [Clostridium butyricum]|uniref:DDE-type integrase/transposase/recombinase n=1 Tax=Clostridium butyricum TaxID=1492 RepID=UPI000ABD3531|nr:DDE-type integrase/transposase/recombinase [Clostridium butyricum]
MIKIEDKYIKEIALFRFSLIAPILNDTVQNKTVKEYLQEISAKKYRLPDGEEKEFTPSTIKEWLRLYKLKGIDGLYPKIRNDKGASRKLSGNLKEIISDLKKSNPKRSAKSIYAELIVNNKIKLSEISLSTVQRFIKNLNIENCICKDRRAFEFPYPNDCWQSDISVGPYVIIDGQKYKTYVIAFLDDCTRLIVSCGLFIVDNLLSVLTVFKDAVSKRGVPKKVFFDNGKVFRSGQMEMICASLGCTLCFAEPYSPQSKGKIERWFQTLQKQWQFLIDPNSFNSIDEVNASLNNYVEKYNFTEHSGIQVKPIEKFMKNIDNVKLISKDELNNIFLYRIQRKVKNDSTVSVDKQLFEVSSKYIGAHVNIRYDPTDMDKVFIFSEKGERLEEIHRVNKIDNSKIRRGTNKDGINFSSFSEK